LPSRLAAPYLHQPRPRRGLSPSSVDLGTCAGRLQAIRWAPRAKWGASTTRFGRGPARIANTQEHPPITTTCCGRRRGWDSSAPLVPIAGRRSACGGPGRWSGGRTRGRTDAVSAWRPRVTCTAGRPGRHCAKRRRHRGRATASWARRPHGRERYPLRLQCPTGRLAAPCRALLETVRLLRRGEANSVLR